MNADSIANGFRTFLPVRLEGNIARSEVVRRAAV